MRFIYHRLHWRHWILLIISLKVVKSSSEQDSGSSSTLPITRTPPQCDRNDTSHHRYDPLACWLWNLEAVIPDQSFRKSIFKISIRDMTCTNFTMDDIDSDYIPSSHASSTSSNSDPSISLSIKGLSALCVGKYKSTGMSGTVQATVVSSEKTTTAMGSDDSTAALSLNVTFISKMYDSQIRMAEKVSTSDCEADLVVPTHNGLKFTGSVSAKIINLFSGQIAGYVSSALSSQLCPALQPELEKDLTNVLRTVDDYLTTHVLPNRTIMPERSVSVATKWRRRRVQSANEDKDDGDAASLPLVDWSRDTPVLHTVLEYANQFVDRYLNQGFLIDMLGRFGYGSDPLDNCGYFFRGLNGVTKSLTKGTGRVRFGIPSFLSKLRNITFVLPKYAEVSVMVHEIGIDGVDKLSRANLLRPINDDGVFGSSLQLSHGFNLTIDMEVQVHSIEGGMFQGDTLVESFQIVLNATDLALQGDLSVDYSSDGFGRIAIGDVISTIESSLEKNVTGLSCLIGPLQGLQFPGLTARMDLLAASFIPDGTGDGGQLEKDLDKMLNTFLVLFLGEYDTLVSDSITGLVKGPGKDALNAFLEETIPNLVPVDDTNVCHNWSTDVPDLFDFNKRLVFHKLNDFLSKQTTLDRINDYINCLSDVFNRDIGLQDTSVQIQGLNIELRRLLFENLGTINKLALFSPVEDGYHVRNRIEFGSTSGSSSMPTVTASALASASLVNFTGQANMTTYLSDISFEADTLFRYDINKLRPIKLSSILTNGICALLPAEAIATESDAWDIGDLNASLSSLLTSSVFNATHIALDTEAFQNIVGLVRSALLWTGQSITDTTNGILADMLPRSESLCYSIPMKPKAEDHVVVEGVSLATLGIIVGSIILIAHVAFLFVRLNSNKEYDYDEEELTRPFLETKDSRADSRRVLDRAPEDAEPKVPPSLMWEERVPRVLRHVFPVVVVFTVALLASSNLSTGASVDVVLSPDDYPAVQLPTIFAFSLGNTIREMYAAGVYPLLAIVVVFSGIWPYAKLLTMLYAWLAPGTEMSHRQRGRLLFLLDALSKFSLVDTFVLVLMMVSFRFHLELQDLPILDVYVNPSFGFYGFLAATTLSLLAGHVALFFHRRSQMNQETTNETTESLARHEYSDGTVGCSKWRMSSGLQAMFVLLMALAAFFMTIGATKKSFVFEFDGLAGALLGDERRHIYSLLTLGTSLRNSVQDPSSIGVVFLQAAFYFYALVMPLACLVAMSVVFVMSLSLRAQRWALAAAEVCNAWSSMEVFALSIIAALFQISNFAGFMVGDKCDLIDSVLDEHFDEPLHGDTTCFMVKASVKSNVWFLLLGVGLNSFVVSVLFRFAHCAMEERYARETTNGEEDPLAAPNTDNDKYGNIAQTLLRWRIVRLLLFVDVDASERPPSPCSSQFWEEYWRISSVT